MHYFRELSLDTYNIQIASSTNQLSDLLQKALEKDNPSQKDIELIKQVFERVYKEKIVLRKSPIHRSLKSTRFITDSVTISNNGPITYVITGFEKSFDELNFHNSGTSEKKDSQFGYDPKTSFLKKGHYEPCLPLISKGPIYIDEESIKRRIRRSLQSCINQNQEEIKEGTVKSIELRFFNQGSLQNLFFYFSEWLQKKL